MLVRGFTVDNNPDPDFTKNTIECLRYTVRCGDLARKALQDIEETGHYDGKVKIFADTYGKKNSVAVRSIRQRNVIVRDEWMPLSDITVTLGEIDKDHHGSAQFRTSTVTLHGTMYTEVKGKIYEVGYTDRNIGSLRFLKSGLSFDPIAYGNEIVPIYKVYKHAHAHVALKEFARVMARQIVEGKYFPEAFVTTDLRNHVVEWLYAEGHSQRIMHEITQQAKIVEVMTA